MTKKTSLTLTLHFDESRKGAILKQLRALDLGENGRLEWSEPNGTNGKGPAENDVFSVDPEKWAGKEISLEAFKALSPYDQLAYCEAHGGPLTVMHNYGLGFTDEDIENWHQWKAEWDDKVDDPNLTDEERLKLVFGEDFVFPG